MDGMVFDIQHFSLHDGPGVRSTVFLQGCPLSCRWCSNPESQTGTPKLLVFSHQCVSCGGCIAACPKGAVSPGDGRPFLDRALCQACGACVSVCPSGARQVSGRRMSTEDVVLEVRPHWRIFQQSGGGVTLSGGEVLAQPDFGRELLRTLHDDVGFHTCIETCGKAPWRVLEGMLPFLDLTLLDIKHIDADAHIAGTGAGNSDILDNARRLAATGSPMMVRLPLIPGFNDDQGHLRSYGAFLREIGLDALEVMPYHGLGLSKYKALGLSDPYVPEGNPDPQRAVDALAAAGIAVTVHGNEPVRPGAS